MKKKRLTAVITFVLLFALSALGIWKSVLYSADIDESYAFTMAVRMVNGDRMFIDMWEPHQMSAFLYAPLVWIYKSIAGNLEGALVFMRASGILVQGLISVLVYRVFRRHMPGWLAMVLAFLYFNFTPKHIQSPEFTSVFYWLLMLLMLCLLCYGEKKKMGCLVLAGLCMSGMVLCYPTMLLVFVYCVFTVVWLGARTPGGGEQEAKKQEAKKQEAKKQTGGVPWKALTAFVLPCLVCFLLFMLYVFLRGGAAQVLANIPDFLMDESHNQSLTALWRSHFTSFVNMLKVTAALLVICHVGRPVLDRGQRYTHIFAAVLLLAQTIWFLVQFHTITGVNFIVFYPLVLQLFVIGWYCYATYVKTESDKMLFYCSMPLNLVAVLAILTTSNLPGDYSMSFLMPGLLVGIWMVVRIFTNVPPENKRGRRAGLAICLLCITVFWGQALTARICLVRFTSTQRKNIFEPYYEVSHGVLKGIRLGGFDYQQYEAKSAALESYVKAEDTFLYIGADMFLYSQLEGTGIGTGNTISTPVFSTQLMDYYAKYPQKIPTVVFVDREYCADFSALLDKEPLKSFMQTHFNMDAGVMEGPVTIYRSR